MQQLPLREIETRIKHLQEIAVIGTLIGIQRDDLSEDVKEWMLQTLSEIKQDFSASVSSYSFAHNNTHIDMDSLNNDALASKSQPLSIGLRIRYARKYSYLKQSHIANALGVTIQAVSLWENDSTVPTCDKIIPLANVLKCDPMWLLTGEVTRQSPATPDHQSRHHHSERLRSDVSDHASHHEKTPSQA